MTATVPAPPAGRSPGAHSPTSPSRRVLLYSSLAILGLCSLIYQLRFSYEAIDSVVHYSPSPRAPFVLKGHPQRISKLEQEAADGGLRVGDQVIAMNGEALRGANTMARILSKANPGEALQIKATRDGNRVEGKLRLHPQAAPRNPFLDAVTALILGVVMPWFSLLLGFYVIIVRSRDPLAWVVFGLLFTFSQTVGVDTSAWGDWVRIPAEIYHVLCESLWPLFMFLFGFYFPKRPAWGAKLPWLKWAVTIPYVLMVAVGAAAFAVNREGFEGWEAFSISMERFTPVAATFSFGLVASGIALLAFKAFDRAATADARRRMRLLFAGIVLSLSPLLLLFAWAVLFRTQMDKLPDVVVISAALFLLIFPLTFAYVIIVDRAMDVQVAIRQGLQYAFARSGLVGLRVVLIGITICAVYYFAERSNGNVPAIMILCACALAAAIPVNVGLKRMGRWIDRRFFREAYDAELVLSELSEQVRTVRETQPLMKMVCDRIANTLHLSKISVLLEHDGQFRTCLTSGFDTNPQVDFPHDSAVVTYLQESHEPPRVYFDDDSSWLYRTPGLDEAQRSRLACLEAELLLPLSTREKLLGFIAVGPKRSEEPYSKSDIRILSSVASQTGLALENAQLTTAIASEMAMRERMAREVEIAREVQERLFPQSFPAVEGLDYWGMCRTALGVGGDYYDFLALPGMQFGVALGDVAGKGISAALLMASLQASLRGEASHGGEDLAQMITNLNSRVFESSTNNRYATFFYGQYNPATHILNYVNAGHNPPILLRRTDENWSVTTLEATGTVVGLLPTSRYEQASVSLQSNDYLLLFTDGISEAMNRDDEEWGEECLTESVRACAQSSLPAAETVSRILSAADAFVNGAKQHDDMTLVALRIL